MSKYLKTLLAALFMGIATVPVQAQQDKDALIAAVDTIVRKHIELKATHDIVEELYEKHKDDATFTARLGGCYYRFFIDDATNQYKFTTRDTAYAFKYLRLALERDSTCAAAYRLMGVIENRESGSERAGGNYEEADAHLQKAKEWFEKGMEVCPNDPELSMAYTKFLMESDPGNEDTMEKAIQNLIKQGENDPSFNANLAIGIMLLNSTRGTSTQTIADMQRGATFLDKCKVEDIDRGDLGRYVNALGAAGRAEDAIEKAKQARERFPQDLFINTQLFYNLQATKHYKEALEAYDYVVKSENYVSRSNIEAQLGLVYIGLERWDEALAQFDKALEMDNDFENGHKTANQGIEILGDQRMMFYIKQNKYDEAAAYYKSFMDSRMKDGKHDISMLNNYSGIFEKQFLALQKTDPEGANAAVMKADEVQKEILSITDDPYKRSQAWDKRYVFNFTVDKTNELGLFIPTTEAAIASAESMTDEEIEEKCKELKYRDPSRVIAAIKKSKKNMCSHLCNYYATSKPVNKKLAKFYGEKVLEIDPADEDVNKIFTILKLW